MPSHMMTIDVHCGKIYVLLNVIIEVGLLLLYITSCNRIPCVFHYIDQYLNKSGEFIMIRIFNS